MALNYGKWGCFHVSHGESIYIVHYGYIVARRDVEYGESEPAGIFEERELPLLLVISFRPFASLAMPAVDLSLMHY